MFQLGGLILRVLKLLLKMFSKSILDVFYKGPGIAASIREKNLEFCPRNNNIWPFFIIMLVFVLCPRSADFVRKNTDRKRGTIIAISSSHSEIIFKLLAKPA